MSLCLTVDELQELTGKIRPTAQRKALNSMGIDCKTRPDGKLVVLRSAVEPTPQHSSARPNLKALNHVA